VVGLEAEMPEGSKLWATLTPFGKSADGNVITATDPERVQTWDLGSRTLQVTYPDARNWQIVLQRYNNLLITVSLILGGYSVASSHERPSTTGS